MEIKQEAIKKCVSSFMLDLSKLFNRNAVIENVGDRRYWEENMKNSIKQYTNKSSDIKVNFKGQVQVLNDQNGSMTEINYAYVGDDYKVNYISIEAKRRTLNIPFILKFEADNFIDMLALNEEIIDKANQGRTFQYTIFNKQFKSTYRILYDISTQDKAVFDYDNTDNGFELELEITLEMHYYAPTYKTNTLTDYTTKNVCQKFINYIDDGDGNKIPIETEKCYDILVSNSVNIQDYDSDKIIKAIGNIYSKEL